MTETELETARKLAKHPRFRWMPGMRAVPVNGTATYRIIVAEKAEIGATEEGWEGKTWGLGYDEPTDMAGFVPDLNDPATMGALLGLVREVWQDESAYLRPWLNLPPYENCWAVCAHGCALAPGKGQGGALLRALELAKVSP